MKSQATIKIEVNKAAKLLAISSMGLNLVQARFFSKNGRKTVATGVDKDPRVAREKALSEVFERYVCDQLSISSNGVAAHLSEEQAKDQAFLELIERDAVMCSWYARGLLIHQSLDSSFLKKSATLLLAEGYQMSLFKIPHESHIPILLAVAWTNDLSKPAFFVGTDADWILYNAKEGAVKELILSVFATLEIKNRRLNLEEEVPQFFKYHASKYYNHDFSPIWREWINFCGKGDKNIPALSRKKIEEFLDIKYLDLDRPETLIQGRRIMRATSNKLQDMIFNGTTVGLNKRRLYEYSKFTSVRRPAGIEDAHPLG